MGILSKLGIKTYQNTWEEAKREKFTEDDLFIIESITVVSSQYGISGKIIYVSGEVSFIPLSRDNQNLPVDSEIDKNKCWIVTLHRGKDEAIKLLVEE